MGEAKTVVGERERAERDAEPEDPVPEQGTVELEQAGALLERRPVGQDLGDRDDADRVDQPGQVDVSQDPVRDQTHEIGEEEQDHAAEVGRSASAAERCQRELDRRGEERVWQSDVCVRREIPGWTKRPDRRSRDAGYVDGNQAAERRAEQDQCIEGERGEKAPAQIFGPADGNGVCERIHPRLHVPRRRVTGNGRRHQEP